MADDYMSGWNNSGPPGSTPHTPLEQGPPAFRLHGVGSSASLCTTDDEEAESGYAWTEEQEQFVLQTLQEYQENPRNTPFSGRFPPSGVVQQVARAVMRRASRSEFPHTTTAVRKRILLICARNNPEELPDNGSSNLQYSDAMQVPSGGALQRSTGYGLGPALGTSASTSSFGPPLTVNTSDYEQFDFGQQNKPVPLSSPFKEDQQRGALRPPLQQQQQPQNPAQLNPNVLNIVAQRKRDSLKMKRGLK